MILVFENYFILLSKIRITKKTERTHLDPIFFLENTENIEEQFSEKF